MSIDRRNFLKALGLAGATLAIGKSLGAPTKQEGEVEFYGMLYDSWKCGGCQSCEIACAEAHGFPTPKDEPKAGIVRKTSESQRVVVNSYSTSKGEVFNRKQCMHCNEPACAAACLTQAMYKTKEGPVIWRGDKCMGCRYCMVSCPFDVPKFEYHSPNPKIEKCDMCYDKIKSGGIPICAEICPAEAIKFGTRRELIREARKRIQENPGVYSEVIYGEHEAGGTGFLYLTPTPIGELGFNEAIQKSPYPELSKGFLFGVPTIFVLIPPLLLGLHEATKRTNQLKEGGENE